MSFNRVREGTKLPDIFILNLDLVGFSRITSLSHPHDIQKSTDRLRARIDRFFDDPEFRTEWSGDGLLALYRHNGGYCDELVRIAKKIVTLLRRTKFQHMEPSVRIGLSVGNITFKRDIGRITGTALNTSGHLQKHCPGKGGILMQDRMSRFLRSARVMDGFSIKKVLIKGEETACYYFPFDPEEPLDEVIGAAPSVTINIEELYGDIALIEKQQEYILDAIRRIGGSSEVILTGRGPVWLYLLIARNLHGSVSRLGYSAPKSGDIVIFDHMQPAGQKKQQG